ncbi:DUF3024 domain-containing protein [Lysobacter enzymogenes]|uniref:DUF3024 domain-containing protein n=1 Tax=Lysobacter enzymogenes TaxID=69 RepID=A0A3N2RJP7_LYSEN|nr:DUF3024 domain-containing protein [Lysobacter enzymogenes]ROU07556.1 DUF3024 domain-containing protein [Lysobacter enzymogenes]
MLNDIERKRAEKIAARLLKPRHSPHVKSGGTTVCRVVGQAIEIYSARTAYDYSGEVIEIPIVKFRYVRTQQVWQLFWSRASGKWQGYEPMRKAEDLAELVEEVWRDSHCCFWG